MATLQIRVGLSNLFSLGKLRAEPHMQSVGIYADQEHSPSSPSAVSSNFQNAWSRPNVKLSFAQKKIMNKQPAT